MKKMPQPKSDYTITLTHPEIPEAAITGIVDFTSVIILLKKSINYIDNIKNHKHKIYFNLSGVTQSNSAGLALMTNILRYGHEKKIQVEFLNIPDKLLSAAKISNLDTLFLCSLKT